MNEYPDQDPGAVRADILQTLTPHERTRARLNIRAARMPAPVQGWVHGLDLSIGGGVSGSGTPVEDDFDNGGVVRIAKTAAGNWSSDGEDTAPATGAWLYFEKQAVTATVPGETDEDDDPVPDVDETTVSWEVTVWEDGARDMDFLWVSEELAAADAEDIFAFRSWTPEPNLEETLLEDDSVETDSTVWLEPIEPGAGGGGTPPVSTAVEFLSASSITDPDMVALGFSVQLEVQTPGGGHWYIPVADFAWS